MIYNVGPGLGKLSDVTVIHGDCIEAMREMPAESVDAIVTDPPYGLGFMGKKWDDLPPGEEWAKQCLRVLKPGGHLLAFGGTRTFHRLACAIEDAGFEIRDSIAWLYGSGFPKSRDISKDMDRMAGAERKVISTGTPVKRMIPGADQDRTGSWIKDNGREFVPNITAPATPEAKQWQGWGTALKPAFEPVIVGRKPLQGTVAANVLAYGTGALNVDGCRIETTENLGRPTGSGAFGLINDDGWVPTLERTMGHDAGRWPANVILDESSAAELDQQSGERVSGWRDTDTAPSAGDVYGNDKRDRTGPHYSDSGGASRFFYCAKAPKKERPVVIDDDGKSYSHSTVKPLTLMRWLVRLVTPPGGLVLDPFAGSGTTIEAALLEDFRVIGIENDTEHRYMEMIQQRIMRVWLSL